LKIVPQPDRSAFVTFVFSEQKPLRKVSEFLLLQIRVLNFHRQDIQNWMRSEKLCLRALTSPLTARIQFFQREDCSRTSQNVWVHHCHDKCNIACGGRINAFALLKKDPGENFPEIRCQFRLKCEEVWISLIWCNFRKTTSGCDLCGTSFRISYYRKSDWGNYCTNRGTNAVRIETTKGQKEKLCDVDGIRGSLSALFARWMVLPYTKLSISDPCLLFVARNVIQMPPETWNVYCSFVMGCRSGRCSFGCHDLEKQVFYGTTDRKFRVLTQRLGTSSRHAGESRQSISKFSMISKLSRSFETVSVHSLALTNSENSLSIFVWTSSSIKLLVFFCHA
jgi:hypothetical protein